MVFRYVYIYIYKQTDWAKKKHLQEDKNVQLSYTALRFSY